MPTIIEQTPEQHQRHAFFEGVSQDFKALKEDAQAWQEELAERALWDNTLLDDIEDE